MSRVLYQVGEDRVFFLDRFSALMASTEAILNRRSAEEAAQAARYGEMISLAMPMAVRSSLVSEERKHMNSFKATPEVKYSASNPFDRVTPSSSSASSTQQDHSTAIQVVADVHALPEEHVAQGPVGLPHQDEAPLVIANENYCNLTMPQAFLPLPKVDVAATKKPYSVATVGIRSQLQKLFKPSEKKPFQRVVQADVGTASIRRSLNKKQAPSLPTLPKPNSEKVTTSGLSTLPHQPVLQVQPKAGEETPTRRAPPPPERTSSLRRTKNIQKAESKLDLPTKFLEENNLYTEEETFVSYVAQV